jgi:hypothetical protein
VSIIERMEAMIRHPDIFTSSFERHVPALMPAWATSARDPNSFYWKPSRPNNGENRWQLECDEFRHQHESYSLEIVFGPDPIEEKVVTGAIRCQANASNLPERLETVVPVRIQVTRGDTCKKVREVLLRLI